MKPTGKSQKGTNCYTNAEYTADPVIRYAGKLSLVIFAYLSNSSH